MPRVPSARIPRRAATSGPPPPAASAGSADDGELILPATPPLPASVPFPLASALVPVVGAVVLWAVTQSPFALWFAALGPLMALGALWDGRRTRRRARADTRRAAAAARARVATEVARRHDGERAARWARHPDLLAYASDPGEVWRGVPGRGEVLVVGRGEDRSDLRVAGGEGDPDAAELRGRARTIDDVPVVVPLEAGVAVVGPRVAAAAVRRGLALQVLCMLPPGVVRLRGGAESVDGDGDLWEDAPHRDAGGGRTVWLGDPGRAVPDDIDIPLVCVAEGTPPPPRCRAVLTLVGPDRAELDHGGSTTTVRVEAVSARQAADVVSALAARAEASLGRRVFGQATLEQLLDDAGAVTSDGASPGWGIVLGAGERGPAAVDLVADGPHAVVVGVTGSGKSELLTSWIVALAAHRSPAQVAFLLVDFKGGRAFDVLRVLPHVTGVVTDLDVAGAVRAIESIRAELRHRERVLAAADARDVAERPDLLPRLVIVVDEFAALAAAHPAVHELFADIVARGRALGVHAILASQRAAGAFRDAVLANAPLRIALRVTDEGDSRLVLGSAAAAGLSGRAGDRGLALVRRAGDDAAEPVRIARTTPDLIARVAARYAGAAVRAPWLPALPARIPLATITATVAPPGEGRIVLGVADEPAQQRQPIVTLDPAGSLAVIGGAGSGRTGALDLIAAQSASVHRIPADPEAGWDAIAALDAVGTGTVVLADDLDLLLARLPGEYAAVARDRVELCARDARARGVRLVVTAQRVTAAIARIIELLPDRVLLPHASRADFVAAGGDPARYVPDAPPGRGVHAGRVVQLASVDRSTSRRVRAPLPWHPHPDDTVGLVVASSAAGATVSAAWGRDVAPVAADAVAAGVLVGTAEQWVGQWRLLAEVRAAGILVLDAAVVGDFRAVTGIRDLPPYAAPGSGVLVRDGTVHRILLPR